MSTHPPPRRRPCPGPASFRRGAVAVAAVIVLIFVQFVIVGAVIASTRDQDISRVRLDTTRAFYATEAGCNMAIREAIVGVDEDHDGGIGSISSDNLTSNDPALFMANFSVGTSSSSGITTILSTGRSGIARRNADIAMQGVIGGSPQTVMTAFGRNGSNQPRFSTWNGSVWAASQAMPDIAGQAKWVRLKICPTRNETAFISESTSKRVTVLFFNGTSWSSVYTVSTDTGGLNDRPEDVAYEQLSSNAVCVYWKGTVSSFGYRVYNGTTFGAEQLLASPFTTEADFVTLYPRPSSNDLVLLTADGIAGSKLAGSVWNGSSFSPWFTLVASLETNNEECYSMAFEAQSGRGLATYTESGITTPRYRTLTGSTWSAQGSVPDVGGVGKWVRLAADPTSNQILFADQDANGDLNANVWNGSWGTNTELETSIPNTDRRQFDIIFERSTGKALIVYVESGVNAFRYRTWNGTSWSSEMTGPNLGSTPEIVWLSRGFGSGEVFIAVSDTALKLHLIRWDGAAMSADSVVENTLSGWPKYYSFSTPEPTVAPHPRIRSWTEVAP